MTRRLFAFGGLALAGALLFLSLPAMAQDIPADLTDAVASLLTAVLGVYAGPVALAGVGIVTLAKIICANTSTPAPGSPGATAYKWLEAAALIFGRMKHVIIITMMPIGLLALAACSSDPADRARAVGADLVAGVELACAAYAPVAAGLVESNTGAVRSLLIYGASICQADGTVVPGVALDQGTAVWIGELAGMLKALATAKVEAS